MVSKASPFANRNSPIDVVSLDALLASIVPVVKERAHQEVRELPERKVEVEETTRTPAYLVLYRSKRVLPKRYLTIAYACFPV